MNFNDSSRSETTPDSDFVRILLSLDVPAYALPAIEADWSLVASAQHEAPDLVPAVVASALEQLQRHALRVTGVAVADAIRSPLEPWSRRAA